MELDVDGGFSATNAVGFPTGWCWHDTWHGYLPVATAEVVRVDGGNVLHYYGAGGSQGCVLRSRRRHVGLIGDIVTLTFEAKGSGAMWYAFYRYSAKGGWIGGVPGQSVNLTSDWRTYSGTFTLTEVTGLTNGLFEAVLGIKPGADAYVRNLHVTRTLETTEGIDSDDFEHVRERLGSPTIVQGDIAPGLLSQTSMGRYTTTATVPISASTLTLPPADERHFVQSSYRLYDFGSPRQADADLTTALAANGSNFVFNVRHSATSDVLVCTFDGGGAFRYPIAELPADFTLSVSADGYYELAVRSLSDSSVVRTSGLAPFLACGTNGLARAVTLTSAGAGATAAVTLDEISTAYAVVQFVSKSEFPYTAEPLATFDPVAAGWDLAFSDEFDGTEVDTNKWKYSSSGNTDLATLADGILHIRTEHNPGTNTLRTTGLWSREGFTYGYFEARLKFTTYNGWWAAFWLCSDGCGNPFVDGHEIDIFEDYYMRNPARNTLDHNLHVSGGTLKSWNYNSVLPGTHDDWYTIACKWTPFEITYYLNGQVITASSKVSHSPYDTVTFDAFRHGTGICPLHAIVSGQIMKTAYGYHADDEGEEFPEDFLVDYVRVYAFPDATNGVAPTVTMKSGASGNYSVPAGAMMDFRVTPEPGSGAAPIKAVHLFDNGYHIATKTNAPYVFTFPLSEEYYNKTRWMNPGRQSTRPDFAGSMHVFSAFAEDTEGRVGHSDTISYLLEPTQPTTPYEGVVPTLPGTVKVGRYDEGGEGVAYHDSTEVHAHSTTWRQDSSVDGTENVISSLASGEWVTYTVDVLTSGWYTVRMTYGTPNHSRQYTDILVDGSRIACIPIYGHDSAGFGTDTISEARVKLPSGRHVLKVIFFGTFNFSKFEFEKLPDPGETYVWTGEAGDGNWKNVLNWQGRTWGWDFPYAGDTASFSAGTSVRFGRVDLADDATLVLEAGATFECDELYTNGVKVADGRYRATDVGTAVSGAGSIAVGRRYRFVTVVTPAVPTAVETTAFRELTNYLFRATGVLPLVSVEGGVVAGTALYVGATAFAAANGVDAAALDEEAWRVKSVGDDLVIAGGGRRGTLYGVYHYLEDVLGVHWFAPTADGDFVPAIDALVTAGLNLSGKPAMRYRTMYYVPGKWSTPFQARNRANTSSSTYGGFKIFGGVSNCHTMYPNIGASNVIVQLFHDHPEYFPLKDGVRYCDTTRANGGAQSQFCLTSPGLRALWTEKLRERIRADIASADQNGVARPLYYAIDQNDCYDGFCKCADCQAIVAREGSNAGLMLDFANDIATRLKDENPDARFMMMALHSSEQPPTYMTASNNVIIRLCDTTSDILRPWTNVANAAHYDNLEGWTAHADGMSMWDYSITYGSINVRCLPVPTEFTYGPDIRTLWEHKGEGFFIEHEDVIASDFRDYKVWLELRLLEDPTLDPDALFTLFTDGHYGAAGPFVRQYRRRLQEVALASGNRVSWYPNLAAHSYLQPEVLLELYDIRSNAVAAVASDATLRHRVEYAFLSLDRVRLVRALYYNRMSARLPGGERLISNEDALARYSRVFSTQREKLGLKAGCSEEKDGLTNFVEAVANSVDLPVPEQFRDVEADLTLIPAAKASLSYAPVAIVPDADSPASNVVRVAIADVKANPVATALATYHPSKFGYPFHAGITPLHAGSLLAPSARERFTAADAPTGYRWYLVQANVRLAQTTTVSPFPGCSIPLDGVVSDNSELGQKYDVYLSVKATGTDWWRVGLPPDDMVVWVDQVAVVRKTKNGDRDPYFGARTVAWIGSGREGDWNDGANWQGGAKPVDGEIAVFDTNVTITSDFALPETRLMISNAADATVTLDCRVSGRGGLDKRGDGELRLMRDNDFEGAFTSRGTVDALTSSVVSSPVRIYAGGAFGRKAAYFDADYSQGHGSRLRIMGPMDVTVPVQLTGDRKQIGGLSFSNVNGKRVRFLKRVWSDFRIISSSNPSGAELVFVEGAECPNFLMPPYSCLTRFNGRVAGTLYLSSSEITNRLAYSGNAISAFNLNAGVVFCDAENVFYDPTQAMTMSIGSDMRLELNGYDQTICNLYRAITQNSATNHTFGFHSPVGRPASLRLVGAIPSHPAFHGRFTGSAGFEWSPAEANAFVFSNTVQTTCGTVEVGNGTVRVRSGAGFTKLGALDVAASATFDVMADASSVRVAQLTVVAGGRLALAKADAVSALRATVAGEALTNGVYTATELPGVISGDGTLIVGALENVWKGTASSDWSAPLNWSRGALPSEGEHVSVPAGAQVRCASGAATPRLASFTVEAGATLVFSNWNTAVCADAVTIAGTVTVDGPFATAADEPSARVRFVCDDFVLAATGVIDVDGKGWAPGSGPGTPGGSSCGAAHGGCGGISYVGTTEGKLRFGSVYGDAERPSLPGSGGYVSSGSAGGGAVWIEASSTAVVDGRILASARAAASYTAGSGGSIFISAPEFRGCGELRADGGNGGNGAFPAFVWTYLGEASGGAARAGGGGRIAVACGRNVSGGAYDGLVVSAAAGLHQGLTVGNHDKFRTEADLGTLVFGDEGIVRATLGKGLSGRLVQVSDYTHEGDLVWTAGHVRFAGDGADVTVTGSLTVSGAVSRAEIGGLFMRTNVGVFADCWGGTNLNRLTVGGSLKLLDGAALDIRAAATNATMVWGGEVSVVGDLLVGTNSYLYPWCDITNLGAPHFAVGGAFTVESNATVMADRRGGMGGRGGAGWKSYFRLSSAAESGYGLGRSVSNAGASHGGLGGRAYFSSSSTTNGTAGARIDDEWSAAYPGAGGGSGGYGEGGEGGGLVFVEAGGRIRIDGLVTADGWLGTYTSLGSAKENSGYCTYFGSGAGGGIHLKGRQIYGSGTLRARGGNAIGGYADANRTYGYASGAGGGGRIFVELRSPRPQFVGTADVSGGHAVWNATGKTGDPVQFPASAGDEGTVRYRLSDNPFGTTFIMR